MRNFVICHLTSVHPPMDTRIFTKECSSLAGAGYETHLIAPDAPAGMHNGVRFHSITRGRGRLNRMTKTVRDVYRKAIEIDADAYHFHDPELLPVGLLLKMKGKKVVYDVHEDVPRQILSKYWIPAPLRKVISRTFETFENFAAKRFDTIAAATPFISKRFARIGCHSLYVNNYPLLAEFVTPERDWSRKERAVTYVGGISVKRGIQEMVKAMGRTDTKLLLAGKFIPASLRDETTRIPGWERVEEFGHVSREEVQQILGHSMAGLVTLHPIINYKDALPVKMFEYMAAGIPVIASDFPLWREIVEGNECGICVDPLDDKQIAEAIQYLVDHPEEAKRMGDNGRRAIEEKYSWEMEAKKLVAMYEGFGPGTQRSIPLQKQASSQ
ncbi:glycosyltransferase family 4 protein [Aneurinibacillus migulanus]|uniref:glycosyltransferase family 4 protein n=1 Tax=Aneurinibacillus migulanus TaxID=47500 RepID=UPI00209F7D73|nr:glycosyltransferase family 4 protein [Aneurinibacillus migulanus]MCP1356999.1 glycosyltransferase family 4 protein [Aneurinibacillus migulanus]